MKRIPIATEPLRWNHPQIGTIHLYPEGSGWAADINGHRAFSLPGTNRLFAETAVRTALANWSFIDRFRTQDAPKLERYFDQTTADRDLEVLKKDLNQ